MRQLSEHQDLSVHRALTDWTWRDAEEMVRAQAQIVSTWSRSHEPGAVLDASAAGDDFTIKDAQTLIDAIEREECRIEITRDVEVSVTYNARRSFNQRVVNLARLRWSRAGWPRS